MDEPTSSLTLTETDRLMDVIAGLKADGVSVVFISHRLHEVEACADRVVVLRDGRVVGEMAKHEIAHDRMIRLMIGRDLKSLYVPPAAAAGEAALDIVDLRTDAYPERAVNVSLRRGEILGLAGLVGSAGPNLRAPSSASTDWPAARSASTASRSASATRARRSGTASTSSRRTASSPACCSTFRSSTTFRCPTLPPMPSCRSSAGLAKSPTPRNRRSA